MILALLLLLGADAESQFLYLLRTYPERPPAQTFASVAKLVDAGEFPERDRAEYWIGSARLAAGDREGARQWFARLAHDYPQSVWAERSWLGLGDASAQEHDFRTSLSYYQKAAGSQDKAVRELARIDIPQIRTLQKRQRIAWIAGALAALIALGFAWRGRRSLWPMPAVARTALPVLALFALLAVRIDPAPRAAVWMLTLGGAVLSWGSSASARSHRLLHALLSLLALGCLVYVAIYRENLVGMVLETFRAGPE